MRLIDISLPVFQGMPVYPGDQETVFQTTKKPSGSQLTSITIGSHAGTHVDAPVHSIPGAEGMGAYSLETFYGSVRVISIEGDVISKDTLVGQDISPGERVLFKTSNSERGYARFHEQWVGLSSEAAEYLAEVGVALVGIDWFGVKQPGASDNRAHTSLLEKHIPILEGLNLAEVEDGVYTLIAFPVAYQGIDGAPVRAILKKDEV